MKPFSPFIVVGLFLGLLSLSDVQAASTNLFDNVRVNDSIIGSNLTLTGSAHFNELTASKISNVGYGNVIDGGGATWTNVGQISIAPVGGGLVQSPQFIVGTIGTLDEDVDKTFYISTDGPAIGLVSTNIDIYASDWVTRYARFNGANQQLEVNSVLVNSTNPLLQVWQSNGVTVASMDIGGNLTLNGITCNWITNNTLVTTNSLEVVQTLTVGGSSTFRGMLSISNAPLNMLDGGTSYGMLTGSASLGSLLLNSTNLNENSTAGVGNTVFGQSALRDPASKSIWVTAMGSGALMSHTNGLGETAFGFEALNSDLRGRANTAIGLLSLASLSSTASNTAVGFNSGYSVVGNCNTLVGVGAGEVLGAGNNNTFIGTGTGKNAGAGNSNLFLGAFVDPSGARQQELWIDTCSTNTPIIWGKMPVGLTRTLVFNATTTNAGNFIVTGTATLQSGLVLPNDYGIARGTNDTTLAMIYLNGLGGIYTNKAAITINRSSAATGNALEIIKAGTTNFYVDASGKATGQTPVNPNDLATKNYVDGKTSTGYYAQASLAFGPLSIIGTNEDLTISVPGAKVNSTGAIVVVGWPPDLPRDSTWLSFVPSNNFVTIRRQAWGVCNGYTNTFTVGVNPTNMTYYSTFQIGNLVWGTDYVSNVVTGANLIIR